MCEKGCGDMRQPSTPANSEYCIHSNGVLQEECVRHNMPEVEQYEAAFSAALENTYTTTFPLSTITSTSGTSTSNPTTSTPSTSTSTDEQEPEAGSVFLAPAHPPTPPPPQRSSKRSLPALAAAWASALTALWQQ